MQKFWSDVVMDNVKERQVDEPLCTFCELEKQIDHQANPAAPYPASNSCAMTSQCPGIWAHGWQVPLITLSSAVDITITQTRRRTCNAWRGPRLAYSMRNLPWPTFFYCYPEGTRQGQIVTLLLPPCGGRHVPGP